MAAIERAKGSEVKRKRPKREYESTDMTPFIQRIAKAMVRRAQDGDLDALEALAAMVETMRAAERDAGAALHGEPFAYSWTEIGDHLGISRQAARQKYT